MGGTRMTSVHPDPIPDPRPPLKGAGRGRELIPDPRTRMVANRTRIESGVGGGGETRWQPGAAEPGTRLARATAFRGLPSLVAAALALVAIVLVTSRAEPTPADPRSVADLPDPPAFRLDSTRKGQIARCPSTSAHPCFAHLTPAPRRR